MSRRFVASALAYALAMGGAWTLAYFLVTPTMRWWYPGIVAVFVSWSTSMRYMRRGDR